MHLRVLHVLDRHTKAMFYVAALFDGQSSDVVAPVKKLGITCSYHSFTVVNNVGVGSDRGEAIPITGVAVGRSSWRAPRVTVRRILPQLLYGRLLRFRAAANVQLKSLK